MRLRQMQRPSYDVMAHYGGRWWGGNVEDGDTRVIARSFDSENGEVSFELSLEGQRGLLYVSAEGSKHNRTRKCCEKSLRTVIYPPVSQITSPLKRSRWAGKRDHMPKDLCELLIHILDEEKPHVAFLHPSNDSEQVEIIDFPVLIDSIQDGRAPLYLPYLFAENVLGIPKKSLVKAYIIAKNAFFDILGNGPGASRKIIGRRPLQFI